MCDRRRWVNRHAPRDAHGAPCAVDQMQATDLGVRCDLICVCAPKTSKFCGRDKGTLSARMPDARADALICRRGVRRTPTDRCRDMNKFVSMALQLQLVATPVSPITRCLPRDSAECGMGAGIRARSHLSARYGQLQLGGGARRGPVGDDKFTSGLETSRPHWPVAGALAEMTLHLPPRARIDQTQSKTFHHAVRIVPRRALYGRANELLRDTGQNSQGTWMRTSPSRSHEASRSAQFQK
ncbi:hypothetical protein C8Q78DRAFT_321141 [Trametes maxima]|nr:hypothetical protein C8Q78DRAFT_321141 [Trametes maxima]